ncbi:hypothetical protein V1506DRAFT_563140 [Lipomyces tetrasporus]
MATRAIAVIGGTGAQGMPVVRGLASSGTYTVRALTRDPSSSRFKQIQSYGPPGTVEAVVGTFASEQALREIFRGAWGSFVNIDGPKSIGRFVAYELAIEEVIKFYVYSNLAYGYKLSGYKPEFRGGHYDAKGRIGEWILSQNPETVLSLGGLRRLGREPCPKLHFDDCGYFKWLFDHPERANGMDLDVAIEHATYTKVAEAFQKVTGKPARYIDTSFDDYFAATPVAELPTGYNSDPKDPATMKYRDNFTGWWNLWRHSAGNKGLIRKNYELLDEIHPGRIRTVEECLGARTSEGGTWGLGASGKEFSLRISALCSSYMRIRDTGLSSYSPLDLLLIVHGILLLIKQIRKAKKITVRATVCASGTCITSLGDLVRMALSKPLEARSLEPRNTHFTGHG